MAETGDSRSPLGSKPKLKRKRKSRRTYRCGYIMNCPNRGLETHKVNGKPAYRCMTCSLTMS